VSAVAVILGLLLIVTFIANYISTTLPSQMGQNDLQHEVMVQNQVSQLGALLQLTAANGEVGSQVTQPITLGSAGAFPFATQDSSTITRLSNGSGLSVNFALVGPLEVPTGGVPNNGIATGCTLSPASLPTGIACTASATVIWNFTAGNSTHYTVSATSGLKAKTNFTTNSSLISVGGVTGASDSVSVFGSHDTVYLNASTAASVALLLVGSNDTVIMVSGTGGASFTIFLVGDYDSISTTTTTGGSVVMRAYGSHDTFTDSPTGATVYYIGFNLENPNAGTCPYDNLANSDTLAGSGGTAYFNNTNSGKTNTTVGGWVEHFNNPAQSACPYVVSASVSQAPTVTGFIVGLRNTYAPSAEVAYDEGAVVFAQPSSIPVFVLPPRIAYANGVLQLFVPRFANVVSSEAGVGTAALSLRLLSAPQVVLPTPQFAFSNNTQVKVTVVSPYAAAWAAYFLSSPALKSFVSCLPTSCATLASTLYNPGGPVGTVILSVPTTGLQLSLLVGVYSFGLS
jgi:hypothetical protein